MAATTTTQRLEALLFYAGGPLRTAYIAEILGVDAAEVATAATLLANSLGQHGIQLLSVGDEYELVTVPETSDVIAAVRKDEQTRELGKASAETLAVILYRGSATKAELEEIRGVNCAHAIRELLIRGLVVRKGDAKDKAAVVRYEPTAQLFEHLGIAAASDLPGYQAVRDEVERFEQTQHGEQDSAAAQGSEDDEGRYLELEEALKERNPSAIEPEEPPVLVPEQSNDVTQGQGGVVPAFPAPTVSDPEQMDGPAPVVEESARAQAVFSVPLSARVSEVPTEAAEVEQNSLLEHAEALTHTPGHSVDEPPPRVIMPTPPPEEALRQ